MSICLCFNKPYSMHLFNSPKVNEAMQKDPVGIALFTLNKLASSSFLDKVGLRKITEQLAYRLTKTGFQAISTTARAFTPAKKGTKPVHLPGETTELFDLNVTEEQQMVRESVQAFAKEVLREQAESAEEAGAISADTLATVQDLGLNLFAVPEPFGGVATESTTITSMLVAEDLAHGDMGQAVAILAPLSVANAITRWGTGEQQGTYLPAFVEENPPLATIAVVEPKPLFNPHELSTTATPEGDDYVLNGTKSLVPLAKDAELFLVAAQTPEGPKVFIVEGGTEGLTIGEDPAMGLRAADPRPIHLHQVRVPKSQVLGDESFDYQAFIDLGTLAWCALAVGTSQAVLDYVIPYANEREAFGEPISHRQAVAFMIADMAIEIDSMRILTWRAVSRAAQGKSFQREAYLARTLCKQRAMEVGTNGVQLLGGHGYTKEYPVERWYRDLRAIGVAFGGLHL